DIHRVSQLAALGIGRLASEQPLQLPFKTAAMRGNGGVGGPTATSGASRHRESQPVALVAEAIKDCSRRGEMVLDPFGGSGTTLIAAQKTGRLARLVEFAPDRKSH